MSSHKQWEHKIILDVIWNSLQRELDNMGNQGWELVAVGDKSSVGRYDLFFKRPKETQDE